MKNIEGRIACLERLMKPQKENVVLIYYDPAKEKSTEIRVLGKSYLIQPYEDPNSYIENNLKHLLAEQCMFVYRPFKRKLDPCPPDLIAKISN